MNRLRFRRRSSGGFSRRDFMRISGSAAFLLTCGQTRAASDNSKPNILLIITDQQHADTIAAAGCGHVNTPTFDALKSRGVLFKQSYSANPVCSPARSAIFTGRTSSETGVYVNGRRIRSDIPNLGQWLSKKAGYETVYSGKWHLPRSYSTSIEGFRVLHTGIGGQGNLGDTGTSRACEAFLRSRDSSRPFLMVASFMQPHDICEWLRLNMNTPDSLRYPELEDELPDLPDNFDFNAKEPKLLQRKRNGDEPAKGKWNKRHWRYYLWSYYRHVEMVDAEVGRVLQALEDTGRLADTLVLFTSDHGEGTAHHQTVRKSSPYDEAARVPLMLSWPGHIPEGKTDTQHLASGLDIVPTVCDYVGVRPPPRMRGISLKPLLDGKADRKDRCIVTEANSNRCRMVRTQRFKYITFVDDPVELLFDMIEDPGEKINLASRPEYAQVMKKHKRLLKEWEAPLDVAPKVPEHGAWWRKG